MTAIAALMNRLTNTTPGVDVAAASGRSSSILLCVQELRELIQHLFLAGSLESDDVVSLTEILSLRTQLEYSATI